MTAPAPVPGPPAQPPPAPAPGLVDRAKDLPWWVWVIVIGVAAGAYWYLTRPADPTGSWESRARTLLTEEGYNPDAINSALDHYLRGGGMSSADVAMIAVAIRQLGLPPSAVGGSADGHTVPTLPSGPSTAGGGTSAGSEHSGYWYVQAFPVGWSATFRGISQQFYGTTDRGSYLMSVNPEVKVSNPWSQIPTGTRVRVPRSVSA